MSYAKPGGCIRSLYVRTFVRSHPRLQLSGSVAKKVPKLLPDDERTKQNMCTRIICRPSCLGLLLIPLVKKHVIRTWTRGPYVI